MAAYADIFVEGRESCKLKYEEVYWWVTIFQFATIKKINSENGNPHPGLPCSCSWSTFATPSTSASTFAPSTKPYPPLAGKSPYSSYSASHAPPSRTLGSFTESSMLHLEDKTCSWCPYPLSGLGSFLFFTGAWSPGRSFSWAWVPIGGHFGHAQSGCCGCFRRIR